MDEMTLDELREQLDELSDEGWPGHSPIRIAWQPTYPLYGGLVAVHGDREVGGGDGAEDLGRPAIYLAGGNEEAGYLPEAIASELRGKGWR